ncbi:uncharacterized protein LOC133196539 [Saccostrea echinata]|uniref:uncharacterized protein LOC133196539 n=1 Tax=Saccostrea echinata TaxID=191078 RepID=UPI002A83CC80|nr:uncharacterized protein LOC133196539 [Saccostrea echinata]
MINYHPKHRGKIVGILCACISFGPVIFVGVYGSIFARGHIKDEEKQDLCGFYLMSAVTFGVAGCLGILFLKQLKIKMDDDTNDLLDSEALLSPSIFKQQNDVTGQKLIRRRDFHYVFWAFIFSTSLLLTFQNNTGTYLKSFGLESYITISATLVPIAGVFSKLFAGVLSDFILLKVPRSGILFIITVIQTICLILSIFLLDKLIFFIIAVIFFGSSNGIYFSITPTMVSEFYGMKYFGRNYGFVLLGQAFCHLFMQQIFGTLYDLNTDSRNNCFGLHCFMWSFIIFTVLSSCATVLIFCLLKKELNDRKKIQWKIDEQS